MYAAANDILGNIVKVTPSSKVVGDLALHLVAVGADPQAFADDPGVVRRPRLGDRLPVRRARRPARRLARAVPHQGAQGPVRQAAGGRSSTPRTRQRLDHDRRSTLNRLLFPGPAKDFADSRERYSDLSVLPTRDFLYGLDDDDEHDVYLGEGVRLILGVESISPPDERGIRTVMCTINGQLRPVSVRDRSVSSDAPAQERADASDPGQVGAPFDGVVSVLVSVGDQVEAGDVRGHDRGDEDGGLDHVTGRRHRGARRPRRTAHGRGRRPRRRREGVADRSARARCQVQVSPARPRGTCWSCGPR